MSITHPNNSIKFVTQVDIVTTPWWSWISQVSEKLNNLTASDISGLNDLDEEFDSRLDALEASQGLQDLSISGLNSDVTTLETNYTSLLSNVTNLSNGLTYVVQDVEILKEKVIDLQNDVSDLESSVSGLLTGYLPLSGGTLTGDLDPDTSGLDLGNTDARWDVFANTIDAIGNCTFGNSSTNSHTISGKLFTQRNGNTVTINGDDADIEIESTSGYHLQLSRPANSTKLLFNLSDTQTNILFGAGGTYSSVLDFNTSYEVGLPQLTASKAIYLDANKKIKSSETTPTELGYLSGVTSAIQTQLGEKLNLSGGTLTGTLTARDITFGATNTYAIGTSSVRASNFYSTLLNVSSVATMTQIKTSDATLNAGEIIHLGSRNGGDYCAVTVGNTITADTSGHGYTDGALFSPSGTGRGYACFDAQAESGGATTKDHMISFQARINHSSGTGKIDTILGAKVFNNIESSVNQHIGFQYVTPSGSGSIANEFGVFIGDMTRGSSKYGVYIAGANHTYGIKVEGSPTYLGGAFSVNSASTTLIGATGGTLLTMRAVATANNAFIGGWNIQGKTTNDSIANGLGIMARYQVLNSADSATSLGRFGAIYDSGGSYFQWLNNVDAEMMRLASAGLTVSADLINGSANFHYFGATATDGTWRIGRSGNNLVIERRESGSYVTKQTITP